MPCGIAARSSFGSGRGRPRGCEGAPGAGGADLADGRDGVVELVIAGVEVGRKPDAGARPIVAEDLQRLEAPRDLVAVLDVDGDGPAPPRRFARGRAAVARARGQLEEPPRLVNRLGADRL